MKRLRSRLFVTALSVFCLLVFAVTVHAATVYSDLMVVYNPDGTVFAQLPATELEEQVLGPNAIYILGVPANPDPTLPTIFFIETTGPLAGSISDIVGVTQTGATEYSLAFASDTDTASVNLFVGPPTTTIAEPAGPYDITRYLSPAFQAAGYTATFQSDAEVSVPEPASLSLVVLGLAGVGVLRRRMRK